jgi:hypothetical protein
MKRYTLALCSLLFVASAAFGQSAAFVDALLESESITVGQGAYLALAASGAVPESADAGAAFAELEKLGWVPRGAAADSPIRLGDYSYLVMRALGLRGGFMYAILPGPRYAYRQLVYSRVIQGRSDPGMSVPGDVALGVIGRALDAKGAAE